MTKATLQVRGDSLLPPVVGIAEVKEKVKQTANFARVRSFASRKDSKRFPPTYLEAQDLATPAQALFEEYRKSKQGYVVQCPGCGEVYSWSPELAIVDALCTKCGKTYNCEFGMLAG